MNGNRLSPEPDRRSFATIYLDLLDQFPRWSQTGTVSTICLLGYFIMILVVILLIVFINFWCLFAQVFDRGHVCRNSVVLIAYIFDEIYLMPLILLNSALWDSVPDGSLQWSSSFLVSVCVCVSNLNRLTLGLLALKEVFSGFAASWGVSRHSARGGGFRTNACWAEHWAPVCLPTTFAKKNTGRRNYAATQISHADSKDWPVCWSGRALKKKWKIGNR